MNRKISITFCLLVLSYLGYSCIVYSNCDSSANSLPNSKVQAGWKLWQEKNCQACHQIYGLGGYMGPDLTNIISDSTKGPLYAKVFIQNGSAKMPDFKLTDAEANNIVQFLSWVDKSGHSKVTADKVLWNGNYNIQN